MSDIKLPIEYAPQGHELPADRLLRKILAWSAIVYGAEAIIHTAIVTALAKKNWATSPQSMGWDFGGLWNVILSAAETLALSGLLMAGVFILKRARAGIFVLRIAVICSTILTIVGYATSALANPVITSYWSTPCAAAVMALGLFHSLWIPVLLGLLTLPSLADNWSDDPI